MDIAKLIKFLATIGAIVEAVIKFLDHILPDPPPEDPPRPNTA